jgi:hypothetical protein
MSCAAGRSTRRAAAVRVLGGRVLGYDAAVTLPSSAEPELPTW